MGLFWAFPMLLVALSFGPSTGGGQTAQPSDSDITLKTRTTSEFHARSAITSRIRTDSIYISGIRERYDTAWDAIQGASGLNTSSIRDCIQHRWIILAHEPRTYNVQPLPDLAAERATAERIAKAKADIKAGRIKPMPVPPNAPVTTIETIDTGERREVAGLTMRHLRQIEKTPGGKSTVSVMRDGWYVTLPQLRSCGKTDAARSEGAYSMLRPALDMPYRVDFKGIPPVLGTVVEETRTTEYADGTATVDRTELIELSRAPVDPKLFEIPTDYREALHTPGGGRDMMLPDTLLNRARAWWEQVLPRWTFWSAHSSR